VQRRHLAAFVEINQVDLVIDFLVPEPHLHFLSSLHRAISHQDDPVRPDDYSDAHTLHAAGTVTLQNRNRGLLRLAQEVFPALPCARLPQFFLGKW
jgi:hypothetical protein